MGYEQRTKDRLEQAVREIFGCIEDPSAIRFNGATGNARRRSMVKQIDLAAKHYNLREEIDAFLAQNDVANVAALEDGKLRALSSWLGGVMDRLATCSDHPDEPPAN
jgi:hypothetical protein